MTPPFVEAVAIVRESYHEMKSICLYRIGLAAGFALLVAACPSHAQDRLPSMPGYERWVEMRGKLQDTVKRAALPVTWSEDGKSFDYSWDGKSYRYDLQTRKASVTGTAPAAPVQAQPGRRRGGGPSPQARGRQTSSASSPDRSLRAFYRDRNLWISKPDGSDENAVTTDGSEKNRIKYGTASWVYGEELNQRTAFWWSPDSKKLAYYRFDEGQVKDFILQMDQTKLMSTADVEPYPKPGMPNPIADIYIYDVTSKTSVKVDVRDGKPFEDSVVGHYVYDVRWSRDGRELYFDRTNRRQNITELAAANPETGKCRAILLHEEWPTGWTENHPQMRYLKDNNRFILTSERTGWKNYLLYDLTGKFLSTITRNEFDAASIVRVDEDRGLLYYMARDGDNPYKLQLHRVSLDGDGDKRLTDPALNHTVDIAPDGKHFVDVAQTSDIPPSTRLVDSDGKLLDILATSDLSKFNAMKLQKTEVFSYKSADGQDTLYGTLQKPSNFNPRKKYPMLVSVYGGPGATSVRETFSTPSPLTELGFLIASFDGHNASGRGKRFLDKIYLKLGTTEIDDQAEGVKFLRQRPYVDGTRVGIYGTSYGGFSSAMCLLRYPDVFAAASASSAVTDWRQYDTIYTERYMWIPRENSEGYDAGSAMKYAKELRGRLMIYYGTADNNVHPNNAMQLISALQRAGKNFEVQVGPDAGHSGLNQARMLEFFIENLVMRPPTAPVTRKSVQK